MTLETTRTDRAPDGADALLVLAERGVERARCSVRWNGVPALEGRRAGFVGHWDAMEGRSADLLLRAACGALRERGCHVAVGPVDGSTWHRYRFTVDGGGAPPFVLEPDYPVAARRAFERGRFRCLASYGSTIVPAEADADVGPRAAALERRLAARDIRLRALDAARFEAELEALHAVSDAVFRDAFLYTPIGREEFLALHRPLQWLLVPDLVQLAERDGRVVGFLLALPDAAQAARGRPVDTLVLKTLGVVPEARGLGLPQVLVARAVAAGRARGLENVIHALARDGNASTRLAGPGARTLRRYAVFARPLGRLRSRA